MTSKIGSKWTKNTISGQNWTKNTISGQNEQKSQKFAKNWPKFYNFSKNSEKSGRFEGAKNRFFHFSRGYPGKFWIFWPKIEDFDTFWPDFDWDERQNSDFGKKLLILSSKRSFLTAKTQILTKIWENLTFWGQNPRPSQTCILALKKCQKMIKNCKKWSKIGKILKGKCWIPLYLFCSARKSGMIPK